MPTLDLPLPPFTDNHTYGRTPAGKQFLKREARDWYDDVRWQAKAQGFTPQTGEYYTVRVVIRLTPTDNREIQNLTKLLFDAIFTPQLDRQIVEFSVKRETAEKHQEGMMIQWEIEKALL